MCIQWKRVLYSVVITWQSNPPISQFNSPCNAVSGQSLYTINSHQNILFKKNGVHVFTVWRFRNVLLFHVFLLYKSVNKYISVGIDMIGTLSVVVNLTTTNWTDNLRGEQYRISSKIRSGCLNDRNISNEVYRMLFLNKIQTVPIAVSSFK